MRFFLLRVCSYYAFAPTHLLPRVCSYAFAPPTRLLLRICSYYAFAPTRLLLRVCSYAFAPPTRLLLRICSSYAFAPTHLLLLRVCSYAFAPTTRLLLLHVCSCYAFACRRSYSAFACQWRVDPPMCTTTIEGEDSIGGPWSVACCSLWVATRKCMHCLHQHFMSDIRQFVHFQDSGCDVWGDCCHCLKL